MCEKVVADVLHAVGEEEARRVFGDQRPVPRPLTPGDLAPCGVEGDHGGAEVTGRPGPLGLDQPQQVEEVVRRVRGASGQPPVTSSSSASRSSRASPSVARASSARASPRSRRTWAIG